MRGIIRISNVPMENFFCGVCGKETKPDDVGGWDDVEQKAYCETCACKLDSEINNPEQNNEN